MRAPLQASGRRRRGLRRRTCSRSLANWLDDAGATTLVQRERHLPDGRPSPPAVTEYAVAVAIAIAIAIASRPPPPAGRRSGRARDRKVANEAGTMLIVPSNMTEVSALISSARGWCSPAAEQQSPKDHRP